MARLVYLIAWLALLTGAAKADPLTIGVNVLLSLGLSSISSIVATVVGSVIIGAAALGASLLSNALLGQRTTAPQTSPSERQATVRQSVGPRVRFYGRVKVGGTVWFLEAKDGNLYQAVTLNEGLISAIQQTWMNDAQVDLDGSGRVTTAPYVVDGAYVAQVQFNMGGASQTVFPQLDAAFTEITPDHRLRGTANFLSIFGEVKQEDIPKVYPQLNPTVRVVMDASIVKSVRTGAMIWSENPADVIYDYLTGVDDAGFAYGAGYAESQINLASFQAFADLCDETVPLKAGGTTKRYRLAGGYAMNEEIRDVLPRMLRACDGDLYMDADGKIAIRGGKWVEPTLTITDEHIITADFAHGQGSLAAFNELTITYMDPGLDYQETEADPWVDSANIALRGVVLSSQLDLLMTPSHAIARRLAKIHTRKQNPLWSGTIVTNFYGFNAVGEDTVRIVFSPLGIDTTFLIKSVRFLDDMTGVELTVSSLSSSTYAWDAELEEGTAPGQPPDTSSPISLDPPDDINVSVAQRDLGGGGTGVFLLTTWTEPARVALEQDVEYRTSGSGTWVPMSVSDGVGLAESGLVNDGVDYDVRVRTRSPGGVAGPWIDPVITVTATADTSAPGAITDLIATPSTGQVELTWTQPTSSNAIGAQVLRNSTNNSGTATLVGTVYGSPEVDMAYTDVGLAAGTYYYWVAAVNGSNFVRSTLEATGAQVVT